MPKRRLDCVTTRDGSAFDAGQERIEELLPTRDISSGTPKVPSIGSVLLAAKRLRWIQSFRPRDWDHVPSTGVIAGGPDLSCSSARRLSRTSGPRRAKTMALMFSGDCGGSDCSKRARKSPSFISSTTDDLRGKTIGHRRIGRARAGVAKMLRRRDVRILATDFYREIRPPGSTRCWAPRAHQRSVRGVEHRDFDIAH